MKLGCLKDRHWQRKPMWYHVCQNFHQVKLKKVVNLPEYWSIRLQQINDPLMGIHWAYGNISRERDAMTLDIRFAFPCKNVYNCIVKHRNFQYKLVPICVGLEKECRLHKTLQRNFDSTVSIQEREKVKEASFYGQHPLEAHITDFDARLGEATFDDEHELDRPLMRPEWGSWDQYLEVT